MSTELAVTTAEFETNVLNSDVPVLVDFWAEWCGPCKMIAPHVEAVAEEFAGRAKVYKVDVDSEPDLSGQLGIMSIPTLLIYKNGEIVDRMVGAHSKEQIASALNRVLA